MIDDPMTQTPVPNQPMIEEPTGLSGVVGVSSLKRRRDLEDESSDAGPNQGNSEPLLCLPAFL